VLRGQGTHNHAHLTLVSDLKTERYPVRFRALAEMLVPAPDRVMYVVRGLSPLDVVPFVA
jgi:hypothetical protein